MISFEKFIEKFPTMDDLEKEYPVGKKITWIDHTKRTIVGYFIDEQFKKKDDFSHLVIMKWWSKYKQRWFYDVVNSYVFYATVEMIERELNEDRKKEKNHK